MPNIIDLMAENGLLHREDLKRVISAGKMTDPLHRIAILTGLVSEEDYLNLVSRELDMPIINYLPEDYEPQRFSGLSPLFLEEHRFIPISNGEGYLRAAVNDPFDHLVVDTLKKLYPGHRLEFYLAREELIKSWIAEHFGREGRPEGEEDSVVHDLEDVEHLKDLASEAPVIKKVNQIVTRAVERGASDVHFESLVDSLLVRLRIDGILHEYESLPKRLQQAVITRIKIMAKLDIAERRLPQDGRIYLRVAGKSIDLRVSCLPTTFGESVVMRILDRGSISFSLETLGFPAKELEYFRNLIKQPYGILLVTGPTGSGKTTTLYSALNTIRSPELKIITIEDPVEYQLDGINQVQVNSKAGMTFANGLRSIVRQDPDVILVGEIRDHETADIAIQSALTGHLVFSTLHTNDAAGAITRLIEMGVEDYLLASSLIGIMAQRLVRLLCNECKRPFIPDEAVIRKVGLPFTPTTERPIYEAQGCKTCGNTGYRGRSGIYELLLVTDEVKHFILENKSSAAIRNLAVNQGLTLLKQDGWNKVAQGLTTITEVLRVAGT